MTKAILFDMDGTLLDTREFITQATEHSLAAQGFPVPSRQEIAKLVGKPFNEFYQTLTGLGDAGDVSSLKEKHREFQSLNHHLSTLYPNTLKTVKELRNRGFKTAIITTRGKKTSLESLQRANMAELFDAVITGDDAELKPNPEGLLKALGMIGELPSAAVMVGDSYYDIQAGKNACTKTIRATYGFHQEKLHDPEPDFIINDIAELLDLVI